MTSRRPRVLLVEDEAIIAASESCSLRTAGFDVIVASSAPKALRVVADRGSIDLVLMDIDLSDGTDGTILAEEILSVRDVPVIFLSSHSEPDLIHRASRISSYGYLKKNATDVELLEALSDAMKMHAADKTRNEREWLMRTTEERHRFAVGDLTDFVYSCYKSDGEAPDERWIVGSMERLTGYAQNEVDSNSGWQFVVHPEDLPAFEKNILGLEPGQSTVCNLRLVTRDQELRWVKAFTQCIADPAMPGTHRIYGGCREIAPVTSLPDAAGHMTLLR